MAFKWNNKYFIFFRKSLNQFKEKNATNPTALPDSRLDECNEFRRSK
jgi:hypothetical protein